VVDIRVALDLDKPSAPEPHPSCKPGRCLTLPCKPAKSRVQSALALAKTGLRLFPVQPNGKKAWMKDWPHRATGDPAVVRTWFRRNPDINIGIVCGDEPTRLLVLDVDPHKGGKVSLEALPGDFGPSPVGLGTVATPGGGAHLYFVVPPERGIPDCSVGKLGPGLDIRGRGGYVLTPPSVIDGKPYVPNPLESVVFPAPDWLLDLLADSQEAVPGRSSEAWLELVSQGVVQGQRNASIASLAGLLFRFLPPQHAETAAELVACCNAQRCRPPLDSAELARTLDSIAATELERREGRP
jgi:hypothetical protein